jgi:hypothetical protein
VIQLNKSLIVLSIFMLTACGSAKVEGKDKERFVYHNTGDTNLYVVEDTETNCKYLQFEGYREGGITTLLKSDGTPDCDVR